MPTIRSGPGWLPLLARCLFVVSLLCPAVFLVVYPDRKIERDDYERAPRCPEGSRDSSSCRMLTDATVANGYCRDVLYASADDFCEMKLRIGQTERFIGVDRSRFEQSAPGTAIRVEVFRTMPTGIIESGRFIEQRGSPREAIEKLKLTMTVWAIIGIVSALYLYRLRRARSSIEATPKT